MRYVSVALITIAITASSLAEAVCVEGHIPVKTELARSWAVVVGRVEGEKEVGPARPQFEYPGTQYRLKVLEIIQGKPSRYIDLFSEHTSGAYPMDVGSTYLAFVQRDGNVAFIDYCGNSGPVDTVEKLLRELRAKRAR